MFEYEEEIERYVRVLENFINAHELPDMWFAMPDHVALKSAHLPTFQDLGFNF